MKKNLDKCDLRLELLLPIIDNKIYKTKEEKELLKTIIDEEKEKERKRKEKMERKQKKKEQREKEQREKEQREKEQREKEQREKEQREKELQESLEKMQGEGVFLNPVNQNIQRSQLISQGRFVKLLFIVLLFLIFIFMLIHILRDKYYK